jgi:CheY-like chemotaxis protein
VLVQHLGQLKGSITAFLLELYDAHRAQGVEGVLLDPSGYAAALASVLRGDDHLKLFAPRIVPLSPVRILVVQNHPEAAKTLCRLLEAFNAICRIAGTAGEACRCIASARWDVVLLDLGLPSAQSLRVAKFVREQPAPAALIGLADSDETWVHEITLLYGVRRLIPKPCSFPDILATILALDLKRGSEHRPS